MGSAAFGHDRSVGHLSTSGRPEGLTEVVPLPALIAWCSFGDHLREDSLLSVCLKFIFPLADLTRWPVIRCEMLPFPVRLLRIT